MVSEEAAVFGAFQIISGLFQLIYSSMFQEPALQASAWLNIILGVIFMIAGLFWKLSLERPLGITLLGISYGFCGLVSILAGGWLYSPLLILSMMFFAISWGVLTRRSWAWAALLLLAASGFLASLITGFMGDISIPLVGTYQFFPLALSSAYFLWYLNRAHVAGYYDTSPIISFSQIKKNSWALITAIIILVIAAAYLTSLYVSPPNLSLSGKLWYSRDWSGGSGSPISSVFSANRGDRLHYTFSNTQGSPVHFQSDSLPINDTGVQGSGNVTVPVTGEYSVSVEVIFWRPQSFNVQYDIQLTSYSQRRTVVQWLFLDAIGISVAASAILVCRKLGD